MKRVVSIILTVILLAGIISVPGITASATDITDIETGTLVTFGSYPQTSVIDPELLAELNSQPLTWTYYDYYCDGKQEDYMKHADVTLSGERYRAVTFAHFRRIYQRDNGYEPDKVYWFRFDPIVWRVLDVNEGLLITENLIDSQPFQNVLYNGYSDANHEHYASNWAYSSLRTWMNEDFYNTAFDAEKGYINNTPLITLSSYKSQYNADTTVDKVFPLSYADVMNTSYGFINDKYVVCVNRIAYGTDYARCQGLSVSSSTGNLSSGASWWRLRNPVSGSGVRFVSVEGYVNSSYDNTNSVDGGIRPALKIDL
ncbi:MAG: DUF6273 domain-containing protein [Clostridia bacterium]|nr:DUF6273 domain-containing protein [Clostridia bacterium]